MQNVKPTDLPCVTEHLSAVSSAISRVVEIAPAPLLPGEKETDYAEVALRDRQSRYGRGMRSRTF